MDSKYAEERQDAHTDIAEAGAVVVLHWTTPDEVDGPNGTVIPGTSRTLPTVGLLLSYKDREVDGSSVLRSDRKLMMSALDAASANVEPLVGMVAEVSGTRYRVMDVDQLAPDGHAILYWLQLRI